MMLLLTGVRLEHRRVLVDRQHVQLARVLGGVRKSADEGPRNVHQAHLPPLRCRGFFVVLFNVGRVRHIDHL